MRLKRLGKIFAVTKDFDFLQHSLYLYGVKEDLIVRLKIGDFV